MRRINNILALLMVALILGACTKNNSSPDVKSGGLKDLVKRLKLQVTPEVHTIDPTELQFLKTKGGSVIEFPANTIKRADGTRITTPVIVKYRELISKSDIIFQHSTTFTDKYNWLESGGQIQISIETLDGEQLQSDSYHIHYNATYTEGYTSKTMGLFQGELDASSELLAWVDIPLVDDTVKARLDTMGTEVGYFYSFFNTTDLGWTNLDRFMDDGEYDVHIKASSSLFNNANTIVYFVLEDVMSVGTLNAFNTDTREFYNQFYQFPSSTLVKFLVMGKVEDQTYYALTDYLTIDGDKNITVDMQPITDSELISIIEAL